MSKRIVGFVLAGIMGAGSMACSKDDSGPAAVQAEVYVAALTGAEENPPVTTTATGTARVEFTTLGLSYTVNVAGITGITAGGAHIHAPAARGINAGVIFNLNPNITVTNGLLTAGSASATNSATINMDSLKVLIRAGLAYVNVHNTANTSGHIRGQLTRQP